jgi:hypothetical protein
VNVSGAATPPRTVPLPATMRSATNSNPRTTGPALAPPAALEGTAVRITLSLALLAVTAVAVALLGAAALVGVVPAVVLLERVAQD